MTKPRILALILFVSVALNIFALAVFAGPFWHHRAFVKHGPGSAQMAALSDETRAEVKEIWRGHRSEMRGIFKEMRAARRALTEALTATPYSEETVASAQAQLDAAMDRMRSIVNQSVRRSAAAMSDLERAAFFERGFYPGMIHPHQGHRGAPPPAEEMAP